MRKMTLMSALTILALFLMMFSQAKAITREPYWAHHEIDLVDPGKIWVGGNGIQHVKDSYYNGTAEASLGTGTLQLWYEQISLNLTSGEGAFNGKFLITIPNKGTIAGTGRGIITGFVDAFGTFVATHGTGDFVDVHVMGSFSAVFTSATHAQMNCTGTSTYLPSYGGNVQAIPI